LNPVLLHYRTASGSDRIQALKAKENRELSRTKFLLDNTMTGFSAFGLVLISCTQIVGVPVLQIKKTVATADLGEVNKKALYTPLTDYPPAARDAGVNGIVKVRVVINKAANVVKTAVVSGPKLLQRVAVGAAKKSKFPPNLGECESCRYVTGVLVYTFNPVPRKP
jgi:hypothetical protein